MPSPFPGMDPYLEGEPWLSLHAQLASEYVRQLNPLLRPKYVARPTKRFITDPLDDLAIQVRSALPDVSIIQASKKPDRARGMALAEPPLHIATEIPSQLPQLSVEIRDVLKHDLVAAIEILSASNKRGPSREEYLVKRNQILHSPAHLVEIDLLRAGRRVPMTQPLPDAPYFILISRAENRPILDVWPIELDGSLPVIPIPLLPDDKDVPLDLQSAFTEAYDQLGFDLDIDYSQPPLGPLSESERLFVSQIQSTRS